MKGHKEAVTTVLGISALVLVVALAFEYQYVLEQSHKLQKLKHEYRMYRRTFKHIWRDYLMAKQQLAHCAMPYDDDLCMHADVEQVMINRSPEHLKQESVVYAQEMAPELAGYYLNATDWQAYTDYMLTKQQHEQGTAFFCWPVQQGQFWLSSLFGPRKQPGGAQSFHYGIDMAAIKGTPVYAAADGRVIEVSFDPRGYGNMCLIKHNDTYTTRYAHLDVCLVKERQDVKKGDLIAHVGDTGNVRKTGNDASHLHFEVYVLGKRVNPLYVLQ